MRDALEIGYRHIDTARAYENEEEVGAGDRRLAASTASELWITTKIWTSEFAAGELRRAAEDSLRNLRVDHVDLLLLHWPDPEVPLEGSCRRSALREDGAIRHAGVSNFPAGLLERALEIAPAARRPGRVPPVPRPGRAARRLPRERLTLTAYSPLAHGEVPEGPDADRDRRGARQEGRPGGAALAARPECVTTAPKASSHARRLENFEVFDFALTDDDRERIAALPKDRRTADPPWAPDWAA